MGIMVVMMVVFLALAPAHMGLTGGGHQHGQGGAASQPSQPQAGNSDPVEPPSPSDSAGHRH